MAMTVCRECGKAVSDDARSCPACGVGAPTAAAEKRRELRNAMIAIPLILLLCALAFFALDWWLNREAEQSVRERLGAVSTLE